MSIGYNRIIKNTSDADIFITEIGQHILVGEELDLVNSYSTEEIARFDSLIPLVASGIAVVNDGLADYGVADGIRLLMDIEVPRSVDADGYQYIHIAGNPLAYDNKMIVYASPRPLAPKTYTHYVGRGDDLQSSLHGESDVQFAITCSGAYEEVDFKFISDGMVYIRGASFGWENCAWGTEVSAEMYSDLTPLYTAASGNLYDVNAYHRIYIPMDEYGTPSGGLYSFAGNPVPVPALDANGNPTGYWDVSADGLSLSYNSTLSGAYDLYDVEVQVARFVQKIPLYGNNYSLKSLESDDVEYVPPGYFMRMRIWNPEVHEDMVSGELVTVSGYKPCRFWGYFFSYRESTLP
jgi:hypothetical protein